MSSKNHNAEPDDGARPIDKGMSHVARFDIFCRRYIAPEGSVVADLPEVANDVDLMKTLYRQIANNQWAISVSRKVQTRARTLAQKAIAAGIPGEQVDGNDAVAVYTATLEAMEAIRAGQGPSLIEAITYRFGDHTTADNASRYRDDEEVSRHWHEDPVSRLRDYLTAQNSWTRDYEQSLLEECRGQVETEADAYLATPVQAVSTVFDHLLEVLPGSLKTQRDYAIEAGHGERNG